MAEGQRAGQVLDGRIEVAEAVSATRPGAASTSASQPRLRLSSARVIDQIATTRAIYRQAQPGVAMLRPESRPCIATALTLYSRILDKVEGMDHDVFAKRAAVSIPGKLRIAGPALFRTWWAATSRRQLALNSESTP